MLIYLFVSRVVPTTSGTTTSSPHPNLGWVRPHLGKTMPWEQLPWREEGRRTAPKSVLGMHGLVLGWGGG